MKSDDIDDLNDTWWRKAEPKFKDGDKVVCSSQPKEWLHSFNPLPEPGRVYVVRDVYDDGSFNLVGIWSTIGPTGLIWSFTPDYFRLLSEVRASFLSLREAGHPALAPIPAPLPRRAVKRKKAY